MIKLEALPSGSSCNQSQQLNQARTATTAATTSTKIDTASVPHLRLGALKVMMHFLSISFVLAEHMCDFIHSWYSIATVCHDQRLFSRCLAGCDRNLGAGPCGSGETFVSRECPSWPGRHGETLGVQVWCCSLWCVFRSHQASVYGNTMQ